MNKYIFILLILLINNSVVANKSRTITFTNQCDFDVAWGIVGTPIKDKGQNVTCSLENSPCFNNQGFCGSDNLCYFKYPDIVFGQDDSPSYYIKPGLTKSYKIQLIDTYNEANVLANQYRLNIGAQYKCSLQNDTMQCLSGDCERSNISPINGQCQPNKGLEPPFTQAAITFHNAKNDYYNINIINGANIPLSITPLGEFDQQNIQPQLFCQATGALPTGNPNNPLGCTWKFSPPATEDVQAHIFTQINRDLDADLVTQCLNSSECQNNQLCGLKYPEDLQTYNHTGYCGDPVGYYTYSILCAYSGVSTELQTLLKCEHNIVENLETQQIDNYAPVEQRCPNSYTTLSLKNIPDSTRAFCHYELYQCATRTEVINGKSYKYLDSCYNYGPDDPESTACCGCVDWPDTPSLASNLCLKSSEPPMPVPCSIDLGSKPPECKATYETKISAPNEQWLQIVKPNLEWLLKACPDALEYPNAGKHGNMQCSSKSSGNEKDNNINYLITFCPNGANLFVNNFKPDATVPKDVSKITTESHIINHDTGDVSKIYSIIIFIIFTILVMLSLIYYATRREYDDDE